MQNMPAGIEAYRIVITGQCGTAPMGYVVKLNYRESRCSVSSKPPSH